MFFSLLYLLSYLLQTLYGMADLYIIGQFGGVADSSAVSIGSQVMHMLTVMIVGLAYIREHKLNISGFSREITMIDYGLTNDLSKFVTEISIPVACG